MSTPVLRRIDLRGQTLDAMALRAIVPRADVDVAAAMASVAPICENVRARGTVALLELTERFDGVRIEDVRVPAAALSQALLELDPQ
ncbi:MAG: histidinol dehydrogenase, partial [Janthinobacterium lividum]